MQRYFPLSRLRLQLPNSVWLYVDKPPKVALMGDILCHKPADLP